MSRRVLQPFEKYQKSRIEFAQSAADLSSNIRNIEALHNAGALSMLKPLLLDNIPSVQQSAALAIGRMADSSEELAESVMQNDIITHLIYSMSKQNRFYKKAACFIFKSVAKHSPSLAYDLVKCGVLNCLIDTLDDFDPSVRESAIWALAHIAKHNASLAFSVVEGNSISKLILCLQEPEIMLKRATAFALSSISQHNEQLANSVADNGMDTISYYLSYSDTILKRYICQLLGNISKHSADLANTVVASIKKPQNLLNCLKDQDDIVKKNSSYCICEIVNKSPENAKLIASWGGISLLVDYLANIKGDPRLYAILSLGFISAFTEDLAMTVIKSKAVVPLRDVISNEPHQHLKAAACYALGHMGRHTENHANTICQSNILSLMLYYYMDPNSNDDLKDKAKGALKKIIDACSNLSALQPLLIVAPKNILKHILQQYVKFLKGNKELLKNFVSNDGLKTLQQIKTKSEPKIQALIDEINSYFPTDIINYYSPDYALKLLNKMGD